MLVRLGQTGLVVLPGDLSWRFGGHGAALPTFSLAAGPPSLALAPAWSKSAMPGAAPPQLRRLPCSCSHLYVDLTSFIDDLPDYTHRRRQSSVSKLTSKIRSSLWAHSAESSCGQHAGLVLVERIFGSSPPTSVIGILTSHSTPQNIRSY